MSKAFFCLKIWSLFLFKQNHCNLAQHLTELPLDNQFTAHEELCNQDSKPKSHMNKVTTSFNIFSHRLLKLPATIGLSST